MVRPLLPVLLTALVASGCFVQQEPEPVLMNRGNGLLTVRWTVSGVDDPDACALEGADAIDLFVERSSGGMAAHASDSCEAFVTRVELRPGSYFADALLMDAGRHPITTAVDLGYFDIHGGDELVVHADFAPSSFF